MINLIFVLVTFILMEATAWTMHKYVMHGFMWYFHKDHHQPRQGIFEKNDFFFLIFAVPSCVLMFIGKSNFDMFFWIGLGILLYGIAYFLVHDVFIHQRFSWLKKTNSLYFRAIRKAHKVHHKHLGKEHGECANKTPK